MSTYREDGKVKCPACQREVAQVIEFPDRVVKTSRHLFQEEVRLNAVGAPIQYTDGFCPGSFEPVKPKKRP